MDIRYNCNDDGSKMKIFNKTITVKKKKNDSWNNVACNTVLQSELQCFVLGWFLCVYFEYCIDLNNEL